MLAGLANARADDPETYTLSIIANLVRFPVACVAYVTDPVTGLQTKHEFPPKIKHVNAACDDWMAFAKARYDRTSEPQRLAALKAEREQEDAKRVQRPTLDALKAKYGADWGIDRKGIGEIERLQQIAAKTSEPDEHAP